MLQETLSKAQDHPLLIDISEVCRLLGINRRKVYQLVSKGILKPSSVQRRRMLFLRSEIISYAEKSVREDVRNVKEGM